MKKKNFILHGGLGNMLFQLSFLDSLNSHSKTNNLPEYKPVILGGKIYQWSQTKSQLLHEKTSLNILKSLEIIGSNCEVLDKYVELTNLFMARLTSNSFKGYIYDSKSQMSIRDVLDSSVVFTYGHSGIFPSTRVVRSLQAWVNDESLVEKCNQIYNTLGVDAVMHLRLGDTNAYTILGKKYIESVSARFGKVLVVSNKPEIATILLDSNKFVFYLGPQSLRLDLALLANASILIGTNSTLSWWACEIQNSKGISIFPPYNKVGKYFCPLSTIKRVILDV
jgi:hypothetical protein